MCYNERYGSYTTIQAAKDACISDSNCQGVYDQGCDAGANDIFLCPIGISYSSSSASCIYQKGGGKLGSFSFKYFTGTKSLNESIHE